MTLYAVAWQAQMVIYPPLTGSRWYMVCAVIVLQLCSSLGLQHSCLGHPKAIYTVRFIPRAQGCYDWWVSFTDCFCDSLANRNSNIQCVRMGSALQTRIALNSHISSTCIQLAMHTSIRCSHIQLFNKISAIWTLRSTDWLPDSDT